MSNKAEVKTDKSAMQSTQFDHEKLDVYRVSIEFQDWAGGLLEGVLAGCRVNAVKHLDEASTSIALNIAEGNGKRSRADRCRYLEISRGSALESAACLDVLVARRKLTVEEIGPGKSHLVRIVSMLSKLVDRLALEKKLDRRRRI